MISVGGSTQALTAFLLTKQSTAETKWSNISASNAVGTAKTDEGREFVDRFGQQFSRRPRGTMIDLRAALRHHDL